MMHRIFIAINLPEDVKNQLAEYQKKIEGLFQPPVPVRSTKKDNLPIALEFLGNLSEEELIKACQDTEEFAKNHKPFTIKLTKIIYGPPRPPTSSKLWRGRLILGPRGKNAALSFTPPVTFG